MKNTPVLVILSYTLLSLAVAFPTTTSAATEPQAGHSAKTPVRDYFVVGKITKNPKKHFKTIKPIADFLAAELKPFGITQARVKFAADTEQMLQYIRNGDVDYVTETAFGAARLMREANTKPILLRWKKGVRTYQSIIFTNKSSSVETIDDLMGKKIVFEDKDSTSGFFIPRQALLESGYSLIQLASPTDTAPPNKIGYVFSGSEQNTSALVYSGLAEAGAVNDQDWNKPNHMPEKQRKQFKKIYISKPFPRSVELVRNELSPEIVKKITEILINIDRDHSVEAIDALKNYQQTKKFEMIDEKTLRLLTNLLAITSSQNLH